MSARFLPRIMLRRLPCKSVAHAHLVRSWLLDHDIEVWVEHEAAATLYAEATLPPSLLFDPADEEKIAHALLEVAVPIDETALEAAALEGSSAARSSPCPTHPGILETAYVFLIVLGTLKLAGGFLEWVTVGETTYGSHEFNATLKTRAVLQFAQVLFASACAGMITAVLIPFARTPREQVDGSVNYVGRWLALTVFLFGTDFLWFFASIAAILSGNYY